MRLVSPDALSTEESQVLESYRRFLPSSAVCVNVMVCDQPWDIRPLALLEGRVWLYRFSRQYDQQRLRQLLVELEGFAAISAWQWRVELPPVSDRFFSVRPYYPSTVRDLILKGEISTGSAQRGTVEQLVEAVASLNRRNLVHGHISLSNVALVREKVVLLDPAFGILNDTRDEYRAPESESVVEDPPPSVDIYGLGRSIRVLLADALGEREREVVERMLLPSPRQRPSLDEVASTFASHDAGTRPPPSGQTAGGKLLSKGSSVPPQNSEPAPPEPMTTRMTGSPTRRISGGALAVGVCGAVVVGLLALKWRYPAAYYELARHIPLLASQENAEFEANWASGDKAKMVLVARAAIVERDPAAENVIVDDIMGGGKPPNVVTALLQLAFHEMWRDSLSRQDELAAVALSLAPLFPQGLKQIPALSQLHPAVIVAAAGQMPPNDPSPQLQEIPLSVAAQLPEPVGPLFKGLQASGVKNMADPAAVGLSAILAGNPMPAAIEAYIGLGQGGETNVEVVLLRLALIAPLVASSDALASQILSTIRDEGGSFGQVVSWFDIDYLAKWSAVPAGERLMLLLQKLPQRVLTLEQYADLLAFPLAGVRQEASKALATKFFKESDAPWIAVLANDPMRMTREQRVALISALRLAPEKRAPFISAWFALKPPVDGVLKLLLARAQLDSADIFNLEASRFLRQSGWKGGDLETLRALSSHSEPLARSLGYAYLNPDQPEQRRVLEERMTKETDASLKNALRVRLGFDRQVVEPPATAGR